MTIRLRIKEKIQQTEKAVTLILEPLDGPIQYEAGQFLTFLFEDLGSKPFRRSYSLSSAPGVDQWPAITVKRTTNGQASRHLTEIAKAGDILTALPPAGQFTLPHSSGPRDIFLIGGGSGITPLFSILKWALVHEPQAHVTLIQADSNSKEIIFQKELGKLAFEHSGRFLCIHLLSRTEDEVYKTILSPASWIPGRLSNALVEDWVEKYRKHSKAEVQFFLCGPEGLLLKSRQALRFLGYSDQQIHQEIFVIKDRITPPAELFPRSIVTIHHKDESFQVQVEPGQTILDAAIDQGVDLPYNCRAGVCSACAGTCLSGEVHMHTQVGLLTTRSSKGLLLTCTGYPVTEQVEMKI